MSDFRKSVCIPTGQSGLQGLSGILLISIQGRNTSHSVIKQCEYWSLKSL